MAKTAKWDHGSGAFSVIGVPAVIMSVETIVKIQQDAEEILGSIGAAIIFYEAGRDAGFSWASRFKEGWNVKEDDFGSAIKEFYADLGWGIFEISSLTKEGTTIRVENSFIARAYGKSETAICHFLSGYSAGIVQTISGQKMDAQETKCIAKGDNCCEFIVSAAK